LLLGLKNGRDAPVAQQYRRQVGRALLVVVLWLLREGPNWLLGTFSANQRRHALPRLQLKIGLERSLGLKAEGVLFLGFRPLIKDGGPLYIGLGLELIG
jgi:hypothetical protein